MVNLYFLYYHYLNDVTYLGKTYYFLGFLKIYVLKVLFLVSLSYIIKMVVKVYLVKTFEISYLGLRV